jgi:hypothetical protein
LTRTFKVEYDLFVDAETGEEFILPTQGDLDKEEQKAKELVKAGSVDTKGMSKDEKTSVLAKKQLGEALILAIKEQSDARVKLAQYSDHKSYTLKKPAYGEYLEAENAAKTIRDDGTIVIDNAVLSHELMPNSIEGMNRKEINDLPPNEYRYLWNKLYASIWPDPAKLPFLSLLVKTA